MRLVRTLGSLLLLTAGGAVLALLAVWCVRFSGPGTVTLHSAGPTVAEIQNLSELLVTRVHVADVLLAEHSHGAEMALLVRGDCDLTIDLAQAAVIDRNPQQQTATVRLPHPTPARPRVDHERTRVVQVRRTGWWTWRDPREDLYAQGMEQAQRLVADWSARPEHVMQAESQARDVIAAFYGKVGWTVAVEFDAPSGNAADEHQPQADGDNEAVVLADAAKPTRDRRMNHDYRSYEDAADRHTSADVADGRR